MQNNLNLEELQFSLNEIIRALSGLAFLLTDARTKDELNNDEIASILRLLAKGMKE